VASGPFGNQALHGGNWRVVGIIIHYAIMTVMVLAFVTFARRWQMLKARQVTAGLLYGILLWVLMYRVVKPMRWPDAPLLDRVYDVGNALFSHCLMVGVPIALITRLREPLTKASRPFLIGKAVTLVARVFMRRHGWASAS